MPDLARDAFDTALPLLLAGLFGGVLGWEREWRQKPAGLRTHMLVAIGSAAFVHCIVQLTAGERDSSLAIARVVEGVVGGIGFIGAGCIFRAGGSVEGLTTAAGLWLTAAAGVMCGLHQPVLAATTTLLALFVLAGLGALETVAQNGNATGKRGARKPRES
jgi:putative Mg2+ transporter-C (MgtC) family protein